jgi:hypothetical protein
MIFEVDLIGIRACILTSLYPLVFWAAKNYGNRIIVVFLTLVFFLAAIYLKSRTMLVCLTVFFFYLSKPQINSECKKIILWSAPVLLL